MEGKQIHFFEVEPFEQEYFTDRFRDLGHLTFTSERLTLENVETASNANIIVSFIYSNLSQPVLDELPKLQGIATMSVGTDHIDIEEAKRREIAVSNVPAYGPNTVAEHAIALLMSLSRQIVPSVERTKEGIYDYSGLTGWDLAGKTIGILGTGKIGSHVARIASGLEMKIIAYDPHPNLELTEKYHVSYLSLEQVLGQADVLTFHLPLVNETKHLIDRAEFSKMKKGVVIINTARGGLINVDALLESLDNGTVSQAGIDVLEEEGLLKEEREFFSRYFSMQDYQMALANHALMRHPKVLVTPHNAFNSKEALKNILETTAKNITGILNNSPVNTVEGK